MSRATSAVSGVGGGKDRQARVLWMSQYKALKAKEENFKREIANHFINNPRMTDMKDLLNEMQSTEGINRQKQLEEKKECLEDIQDISKRVFAFRRMAQENKLINESLSEEQRQEALRKITSTMDRIENQCIVFKQTRRQILQTLNTEEKILMKDITMIEALIDDPNWLKEKEEAESIFDNPEKMKAVKQYLEKRENYKVPQEVIDFDNYVAQHGGLTGNWDVEDHSQFLKLRGKFTDSQLFISKCVEEIKTRSIIEIQEHEDFYRQYLILLNQKKYAIQKWKDEKTKKKDEQIEIEEDNKIKQLEREEEQRKKDAKRQKVLTKMKLEAWKLERENMDRERKEAEEKEVVERKQKISEDERKRKEEKKELLEKYKLIKEEKQKEKQKKLVEELSKKSRPPSAAEVSRVKEREEQYLKRAQEWKVKKEREAREKEERLNKIKEKVKVEVEPNVDRLFKPTQAHINREVEIREHMAQPKSDSSRALPMDVRMISHRTVPSWRK